MLDYTTSPFGRNGEVFAPPPPPRRLGETPHGDQEAAPARELLPHHREELKNSGLSAATIAAAGIYSETDATRLARLLDRSNGVSAPALVFPFVGTDGANGYSRIKPDHPRTDQDGKSIKYESPVGRPNEIYLPPGVAELLGDPNRPLLITEGEKKSLSATQFGFPCIGLVGVWGWKVKVKEVLLPALKQVVWKDRDVWIVFDSDAADNLHIQLAERRLAQLLAESGATVRITRLPAALKHAETTTGKVGLDDFLVAEGVEALQRLLDEAPLSTLHGNDAKRLARLLDPGVEAVKFLDTQVVDGVPRIRHWLGKWWLWEDGAYRELATENLHARLLLFLDTRYRMLKTSPIRDVQAHVQARVLLETNVQPPTWLDGEHPDWPIHEVLATKTSLVHLPSLGTEHAAIADATPLLFSTSAMEVAFDPSAPAPQCWLDFLNLTWPDDPQSIDALQEFIGYLLTPDTRLQKILYFLGPTRSGKGVIMQVIQWLLGEGNFASPPIDSLGTNFGLQALLDKPLAIVADSREDGQRHNAATVERLLSISGEDSLTVDRKHLSHVTVKLRAKLVIVSNQLPGFRDTSGALAERFLVLKTTESFLDKEDITLKEKLKLELPGILLWAIEGWRRLWARGRFLAPDSGREDHEAMRDSISPIRTFARECLDIRPEGSVGVDELYQAWCAWCQENGYPHPGSKQVFGKDLRAVVPRLRTDRTGSRTSRNRVYHGVGLRQGSE